MQRSYRFSNSAALVSTPLLLPLATILLFSFSLMAQPGDEGQYLNRATENLKRLNAQISKTPNDPDLYFERGQIYLHWFSRYGDKVEYQGTVYAIDSGTKALADLERAIQLEPRGPFFVQLGKYYEALFRRADRERAATTADTTWPEIKRRYWDDELLRSVLDTLRKGVENATDTRQKMHALAHLGHFYHSRASQMSSGLFAKVLLKEKQTKVVYDDYDKAIDLEKEQILAALPNLGMLSGLVDLYREKSNAAMIFGDHIAGIRVLGEGIEAVTDFGGEQESVCYLYVRRGKQYAEQKDLAAALRDYSFVIDKNLVNCLDVYEKRGDTYAALGEWRSAVEDYTREMALFQHRVPRLHTKRGIAYLRAGDGERAVADLDQALEFSSCGPRYRFRAEALGLLNKNDLADEDEKKAVEFSRGRPNDPCLFL